MPAVGLELMTTVMVLKLVSFAHVNHDIRVRMIQSENIKSQILKTSPSVKNLSQKKHTRSSSLEETSVLKEHSFPTPSLKRNTFYFSVLF